MDALAPLAYQLSTVPWIGAALVVLVLAWLAGLMWWAMHTNTKRRRIVDDAMRRWPDA